MESKLKNNIIGICPDCSNQRLEEFQKNNPECNLKLLYFPTFTILMHMIKCNGSEIASVMIRREGQPAKHPSLSLKILGVNTWQ